jgi:polyhydroxybutyrate depolymerase
MRMIGSIKIGIGTMKSHRRVVAVGVAGSWIMAMSAAALIHCGNSGGTGPASCQDCANGAMGSSDEGIDGASGSASGNQPSSGGSPSGSSSGSATATGNADSSSPGADAASPVSLSDSGTAGCGASTWPASGNFNLDVSGTQRQYIVTLPTNYTSSKPYKLIFAWHGLGGSAAQVAGQGLGTFGASYAYYGLEGMAGSTVIFVSGQGLDPYDAGAGWQNLNDEDIAFTKAMLKWLQSNYCIDDKHVFSVGMSYGGIMSDTVGCEMGDVVRAIAPMSGEGPATYPGSKACVGKVAVWMSHGNQDTTVPFKQGEASRDHWVAANHCGSQTTAVGPGTCVEYQGCDPGYPVDWCEFDGGHTIPSFASQGIWSFLSRF